MDDSESDANLSFAINNVDQQLDDFFSKSEDFNLLNSDVEGKSDDDDFILARSIE